MSYVTINCASLGEIEWKAFQWNGMAEKGINIWRASIRYHHSSIDYFTSLLHPGESIKSSRFLQEEDRQRFIISRGMLRLLLSRYLSVSAEEVMFSSGRNGKLSIGNANKKNICFNVSHSGDWVLIAIGCSETGVDVEKVEPSFSYEDIVARCFSAPEKRFIQEAEKPLIRFYQLWTQKEALLKATSIGLIDDLSEVSLLPGVNLIDSNLIASFADWHISSFQMDENHIGSVAAHPGTALAFYNFDWPSLNLTK